MSLFDPPAPIVAIITPLDMSASTNMKYAKPFRTWSLLFLLLTFDTFILTATAQLACDFDSDGECNVADIDRLTMELWLEPEQRDLIFDLNIDGMVNGSDTEEWLELAAVQNGFAAPFLHGDSNLDGTVNATDLNALGRHWLQPLGVWSEGNSSCSSAVDVCDLMHIGLHWQQTIPLAAAQVPEPMGLLLLLVGVGGICQLLRRAPRRMQSVLVTWVVCLVTHSVAAIDIFT
jgi:hypothetical protein